jgi:hypothetical protein
MVAMRFECLERRELLTVLPLHAQTILPDLDLSALSGHVASVDVSPRITITDATIKEGKDGVRDAKLTVSLSEPFYKPVTVGWHTCGRTR